MGKYVGVLLAAFVMVACGGDPGDVAGETPTQADVPADSAAPDGPSTLAPDEMPPFLGDFPLPDDVTFPSPPLEESGRLIVTLNSQTDVEEVKALIDEGLPAAGYEVTQFIEQGPAQWQFVKDGRAGIVNVDSNPMGTIITINVFAE